MSVAQAGQEKHVLGRGYERAALAIQAAERALAAIRRLLTDPAVNGWTEDERISALVRSAEPVAVYEAEWKAEGLIKQPDERGSR